MRMRNPRNALSSSMFSASHPPLPGWHTYYSPTIFSIRSAEKKSWNTSTGDAEMGTFGPTGDVKGLMVTGLREEDHEVQLLVLVGMWVFLMGCNRTRCRRGVGSRRTRT